MQTGPMKSNTLRRGGGVSLTTRGTSPMRCTLPITAFLVTPIRRPISAVVTPSSHNSVRRAMRSGVQVGSTCAGAQVSSLGSSVQVPSILYSPVFCGWSLIPHKIKYHSCGSVPTAIYMLWLVGGKTATSVRNHLRKVSERALLRGEARPDQPVEILNQVTRVVWLMKGNWKIV